MCRENLIKPRGFSRSLHYKINYLLINYHDNDFYVEMCRFAELIIDMFLNGELNLNNYKDKITATIPKFMACFNCLKQHCENITDKLNHLEKYFSNGITCLSAIEEIKQHCCKYNYEKEYPIISSGLFNDKLREEDPYFWINSLKLSMNAETIFIQLISTQSGRPIPELTTYRYF